MDETAIRVADLCKSFRLPNERHTTLKSKLTRWRATGYDEYAALSDVSFEVKRGDFFGIVGRNGSGKSTLLKLLAGIYTPSAGSVDVTGKLTPFVELGVGFNAELSGRDNVFLNGALLGFDSAEVSAMYDEIVEFAGLERFMDLKLKNYSSGMQVRLAFSLAIRPRSDIMLIDEVLAVGDADFQRKCFALFDEYKQQSRTVVLVTHDMGIVSRYCTRAMAIDQGRIVAIGESEEAAQAYRRLNAKAGAAQCRALVAAGNHVIGACLLTDEDGKEVYAVQPRKRYRISVEVENRVSLPDGGVTFTISSGGVAVAGYSSYFDPEHRDLLAAPGKYRIEFAFTNTFKNGLFALGAAIYDYERLADGEYFPRTLAVNEEVVEFMSGGWSRPAVMVEVDFAVSVTADVGVGEQ